MKKTKYVTSMVIPDNVIEFRVRKNGVTLFHRQIMTKERVGNGTNGHRFLFDSFIKYLQDNFDSFFSS